MRKIQVLLFAVILGLTAPTFNLVAEDAPSTKPTVSATVNAEVVPMNGNGATSNSNVTASGNPVDVKNIIAAVVAAQNGQSVPDTFPLWLKILIPAVMALWGFLIQPLIGKLKAGIDAHIASLKSQAAANQIDLTKSLFEQKSALAIQVKAFVEERVWTIAQQEYPAIARQVLAGNITDAATIKTMLYQLNTDLQGQVVAYFKTHGVDVVTAFGKQWLEKLIDDAVDALPAFPGKDTAKELVDKTVSQLIVDYGVSWVQKWYAGTLPAPVAEQAGLDGPPAKLFAYRYPGTSGPKGVKALLQRTTALHETQS